MKVEFFNAAYNIFFKYFALITTLIFFKFQFVQTRSDHRRSETRCFRHENYFEH